MSRWITGVACAALLIPATATAADRTESTTGGTVEARLTYAASPGEPPGVGPQHLVVTDGGTVLRDEVIDEDRELTPGRLVHGRPSLVAVDLDGNGIVEVVLDEFTGEAHCCLQAWIHHGARRTVQDFGDAGYRLRDVDGDGAPEFVSANPRFVAPLTSYLRSRFPLQVWRWRAGSLEDVTRTAPVRPHLRRETTHLRAVYRAGARRLDRRPRSAAAADAVRAALAAHAADQCSLGRCAHGLGLVRAAAGRREIRAQGLSPSDAATRFVRDLRRLLARRGYLR